MAVQNFLKEMEVRIERLQSLPAVYVHSCGLGSDQDAAKRIMEWASINGLIGRKEVRLFGRTTYPVDKSKPHGYECYLTVGNYKSESTDVEVREMPSGLYAVLRFKDLEIWILPGKSFGIGLKKAVMNMLAGEKKNTVG